MVDGPTYKNQAREVSEIDKVRLERRRRTDASPPSLSGVGRASAFCDWWTEGKGRRREGKLWVGKERRGKPSSNSRQ